ncbi:hypothetical protein K474DRAFT_1680603 [Panus rudis PR-1116 ss-1]|nr:hypothetical protein K474DRAFT_1680603 [Panus rudis PR-1116 ss-1]
MNGIGFQVIVARWRSGTYKRQVFEGEGKGIDLPGGETRYRDLERKKCHGGSRAYDDEGRAPGDLRAVQTCSGNGEAGSAEGTCIPVMCYCCKAERNKEMRFVLTKRKVPLTVLRGSYWYPNAAGGTCNGRGRIASRKERDDMKQRGWKGRTAFVTTIECGQALRLFVYKKYTTSGCPTIHPESRRHTATAVAALPSEKRTGRVGKGRRSRGNARRGTYGKALRTRVKHPTLPPGCGGSTFGSYANERCNEVSQAESMSGGDDNKGMIGSHLRKGVSRVRTLTRTRQKVWEDGNSAFPVAVGRMGAMDAAVLMLKGEVKNNGKVEAIRTEGRKELTIVVALCDLPLK